MWWDALWLKVPQEEIEEKKIYQFDLTGRFAYFRCEAELPAGASLTVDITASSRYRLWVNESSVLSGPCKGDAHRQYYETVELTSWLKPGKNVFCVQVLYCDTNTTQRQTEERAGIYGVIGPNAGHRLAIEGDVLDENGAVIASITTGKAPWRVWLDNTFYLKSVEITQFLGAVAEAVDLGRSPSQWKNCSFDDQNWRLAEPAETVLPTDPLHFAGVMPRFQIRQREIPLLYEREEYFGAEPVTVAPGEKKQVILDAGAVVNGYPKFRFSGSGAEISITYFEKFGGPGSNLRRDDHSGAIIGLTDRIRLADAAVCYEPFWVRTFRFVSVTIQAGACQVRMLPPCYSQTGYPLEPKTEIRSSVPWVGKLWEICVRTLGNCMLETYMDCPYYEQLQFGMDTRLEMLFTYAVTRDHALARKALVDFHYGMLPDGLTPGKYPSSYLQVLSTFSLHDVIMLREYLEENNDPGILKLCKHDVDRILGYFEDKVGTDGLLGRLGYWEFVDWHPRWNVSYGMPEAVLHGPSTVINLMYAYALDCGATVQKRAGRPYLAEEYARRRTAILAAVQEKCWDEEKGLFREGPEFEQYSYHAQAWAVQNRMVTKAQARDLLRRVMADEDALEFSFSTAFEWFRALEWAGLYEEMRESLEPWICLLDLNCTTCPETPVDARSDCHAWSALPMYELVHTVAGVKWEGDQVWIAPQLMGLQDLSGTVLTPKGSIEFRYEPGRYAVILPENMTCEFIAPSGKISTLHSGGNIITE